MNINGVDLANNIVVMQIFFLLALIVILLIVLVFGKLDRQIKSRKKAPFNL